MPQALDTTILFIPHASHAGEPHSIDKEGQPACELHSRTEVWPAAHSPNVLGGRLPGSKRL